MAKIIYKEGFEGLNTLKSIEGIEIELLNGQKALIYPKFAEKTMLPEDKIASWDAKETREIEALKKEDNLLATYVLLKCGSPAAKFVAQFRADERYLIFALPTLLAAMELQDQKNDIDELAETIEGADLLRDFTSNVWSCSRCNGRSGWFAYGSSGFASGGDLLYDSYLAVPTIVYDSII